MSEIAPVEPREQAGDYEEALELARERACECCRCAPGNPVPCEGAWRGVCEERRDL